MAHRYTATDKWNDPWFCGLTPGYKLFWIYLCDTCNHAGIWNVNWPLVKFHCWEDKFDVKIFGDRIVVINQEKWFIKKFVLFQQRLKDLSELNPLNKCHSSIITILGAEGLISPIEAPTKGLGRGYSNSNVIVTKRTTININTKFMPPTPELLSAYCLEAKNGMSTAEQAKFIDFYKSKGWKVGKVKMVDWKASVRNWLANNEEYAQPKSTAVGTPRAPEALMRNVPDPAQQEEVAQMIRETAHSMGIIKER